MNTAPDTEGLIGRCYTKARRTPVVIGAIRDVSGNGRNLRLPFGPYTLTQLGVMVATIVLLVVTRSVWGGHGWADLAVLLVTPFLASFVMRHLHIDGRNPAAAVLSVAVMLSGPRRGRLRGRPYTPARPRRDATVITVSTPQSEAADYEPAAVPMPSPAAAETTAGPAPAAAPTVAPIPVLSGVQALLARRATSLED